MRRAGRKRRGWGSGENKNANRKAIRRRGEAPGNNPAGAWRTRDPSRFFRSKTKGRFKTPPAPPRPAHFFLMEFRCPSLGVRVSSSLSLPLLSCLSLFARSPQLSLARSPLPPLTLSPAPPSARPLPPSRLPRRGSRARAPLLRPGLGAPAPRRLEARAAGRGRAAKQRHSAAAAARRWHGGGARERWLKGELGCPPFPGLTCCLSRKLTSSPSCGANPPKPSQPPPPRPPPPPCCCPAAPSVPLPRPLGHLVAEARGSSAETRGHGV